MSNSSTTMALLDIATTYLHGLNNTRGPNMWLEVKDDPNAYGRDWDYEIIRMGQHTVINPVCNAALQYCYYKLPQDCPRYGAVGFKLSMLEAQLVMRDMAANGLKSEDEYIYAMNAEDRDRHQGELR